MEIMLKVLGLVLTVTIFAGAVLQTVVAVKLISYRKDGVGIDEIVMRSLFIEPKLEAYVEPDQVDWLRKAIKLLWKLIYAIFAFILIGVVLKLWV